MKLPEDLADRFEYWLQGQVNTCASGHDSRLQQLERGHETAQQVCLKLVENLEALEARIHELEHANAELLGHIARLERNQTDGVDYNKVNALVESALTSTLRDLRLVFK